MRKDYQISIIGAGRVAWHLAPALEGAGHSVQEIYSRRPAEAQKLADRLYHTTVLHQPDFSRSTSELLIIAVADDAIREVATSLRLPSHPGAVVHTSGSQPLEALQKAATPYTGVFYPLQTFNKHKQTDFRKIPICLEADDHQVLNMLTRLAKSISPVVRVMHSKERLALHVAAVFACNFTNHLLYMAETLAEDQHIDFGLLHPLITETLGNSLNIGPQPSQTGPAVRSDQTTLKKHRQYLRDFDKTYLKIYKLLSEHIADIHKVEDK